MGGCSWALVSHALEPSVPRQGVAVAQTRVSLAFSTAHELYASAPHAAPPQQPVFAYLPLRSYGLRFIAQVCVQGDQTSPQKQRELWPERQVPDRLGVCLCVLARLLVCVPAYLFGA